ncbi:MAG: DnaD domain protein [Lachnospiraceae bacterium]|nr:DnaD domain protein [Lachnospiraceae bacterium]
MSNISLSMSKGAKSTVISNHFIDVLMPGANGTYVKVYIYLLRLMSDSSGISLQLIADRLDETEKDIRRALSYWEEKGLLIVKYNSLGEITDIVFQNPEARETREKPADIIRVFDDNSSAKAAAEEDFDCYSEEELDEILPAKDKEERKPLAIEDRPSYSPSQIKRIMDDKKMRDLNTRIEKCIGRPLSQNDFVNIMFFTDCLQFSSDLTYLLYEYCNQRGKANSRYVETVALNWATNGIRTVEDVKAKNILYAEQIRTVCKAFGFNREPGEAETMYIRRWFNDFGFSTEMVKEACDRTLLSISKPDFKYADKILTTWHQTNIRTIEDLKALDQDYKKSAKRPSASQQQSAKAPASASANKFNKFQQRPYSSEELASLEKLLMNN